MASLSDILSWINEPEPGVESGVAESLILQWLQNSELAEQFARLPWLSDGVDSLERDVLEGLQKAGREAPALAEELMAHSWVVDVLSEEEKVVINAIAAIASEDVELAREVAALPWLSDGVTEAESIILEAFASTGSTDLELMNRVTMLAWLNDGIDWNEAVAVKRLFSLAVKDADLGEEVMSTTWFTEEVDTTESQALVGLDFLASNSVDLAKHVAGLSWFSDNLTEEEEEIVDAIASMSARNLPVTERLVALPWLVDDVTEAESVVVGEFASLEFEDVEAADWTVKLEWMADGVSPNERRAIRRVLRLRLADVGLSDTVAGSSWLSDGVTVSENEALDSFVRLANRDVELTKELAGVPWLADDLREVEGWSVGVIDSLASRDTGLARKVVDFRWFGDGLTTDHASGNEGGVLEFLRLLSNRNIELGQQIADLPWLIDAVSQPEAAVIHALSNIAGRDVGLAGRLASLPWVRERATGLEWGTTTALDYIAEKDVELANSVSILPWLADGVTWYEKNALERLGELASMDGELARRVAALPWFNDDLTRFEAVTLLHLNTLASSDAETASELAELPWFIDGVAEPEAGVRRSLTYIASIDLQLTEEITSLPWFSDGLTRLESSAIVSLGTIAGRDVEFAREIISWPRYRDGIGRELDIYLLYSLSRLDEFELGEVREQSWFVDGLDDDEAVLVGTLPFQDPELQRDLMNFHIVNSENVSLQLAGEVKVWVVQNSDFELKEDVLLRVNDALRVSENVMGTAFPTTDVILLVASTVEQGYVGRSGHFSSHMVFSTLHGELYSLAQNIVNYYFADNFQPHEWLVGGGTGFVVSQFNHQEGREELSERKSELRSIVQTHCVDWGVENIRHHAYLVDNDFISVNDCSHFMGESLLHGLAEIMGEEAMSSALNEIYVSSGGHAPALRFSTPPSEEEIFEAFMSRTAAQRQGEMRELFQRLHGGDFAFPEIDYDDGEADRPTEAADVGVGEVVGGSLDYIFDFDFFRFEAKRGQQYSFSVDHSTLGQSSITLYGPNGLNERREGWRGRQRGPDGPVLLWQAQSSGVYYFAVQNFGGKSGDYTFTIELLEPTAEADDHGDTFESATEVIRGQRVSGNIDHSLDYDYFRFSAREGEGLAFSFHGDYLNFLCTQVYHADGSATEFWANSCKQEDPPVYEDRYGIHWWTPHTGEYYLVLYGMADTAGAYEFEIGAVS